jgi:hypothetical protein
MIAKTFFRLGEMVEVTPLELRTPDGGFEAIL